MFKEALQKGTFTYQISQATNVPGYSVVESNVVLSYTPQYITCRIYFAHTHGEAFYVVHVFQNDAFETTTLA